MKKFIRTFLSIAITIILVGFLIPENPTIPVKEATKADWNINSFWFEPWGISGVHKGIDIFAVKGQPVLASTDGIILATGSSNRGGNYIVMLGAKWRIHYFAHLQEVKTTRFAFKKAGNVIATLGDTGNAKGKQPHLHWSIKRLFPAIWEMDSSTQGHKKSLYIDPHLWLGYEK